MVADPMSPARVRDALNRYNLARIQITLTDRGATASAFPASYHPIIALRQAEALAGRESVTLAELQEVSEKTGARLASYMSDTPAAAFVGLVAMLKRDAAAKSDGR